MKTALASLSLLLAACNAPPSSPGAVSPPEPGAPAAEPAAPSGQASMAKRAPGQEQAEPLQVFRAFGTEPFWNVNVEEATLTYTTPEDQAGVVMQGVRRAVEGGVEVSGTQDGKAFVLTVTAGDCSDGMSDNRYVLVSSFRFGDIDYKGCGEAAR